MAWGTLSDRLGPRLVVLTGSVVLAAGLALASRATSLLEFQLLFGVLVGGRAAAIFAPMMACVTGWFDTHRSLAVSLVSAGMGMAPMTMSPFAAWLVSQHRLAHLAADHRRRRRRHHDPGGASGAPPAGACRAPAPRRRRAAAIGACPSRGAALAAVHHPACSTNFFCCATHSGPIFHTVSYAVTCGIPLMAAVSIYSVEGLAGHGRAHRLRPARRPLRRQARAGPRGCWCRRSARWPISSCASSGAFYAVAALFGFIYAGVMPLYAVLVRENFPLRMMGTIIGGTAMAGSLGMATGPLAGGLIYDAFASYTWLYIGAWAMGLGAFLIALTFRPMQTGEPAPAPAAA